MVPAEPNQDPYSGNGFSGYRTFDESETDDDANPIKKAIFSPVIPIVLGGLIGVLLLAAAAYRCYRLIPGSWQRLRPDWTMKHKQRRPQVNSRKSAAEVAAFYSMPLAAYGSADPTMKAAPQRSANRCQGQHRKSTIPHLISAKHDADVEACLIRPSSLPTLVPSLGSLSFEVKWLPNAGQQLSVSIISGHNLEAVDPRVKIQLLSQHEHQTLSVVSASAQTRSIRDTSDPVFNESFTFYDVPLKTGTEEPKLILLLRVYNVDRYSRDYVVGELRTPLNDLEPGVLKEFTKELQPVNSKQETTPQEKAVVSLSAPSNPSVTGKAAAEVLLALCYQPAANRITVVVLKAKNLPSMDWNGLADPYVKLCLFVNGERQAKKKTQVKKRTINPVYNESFMFDLSKDQSIQNVGLQVLVVDWDRMSKNDSIGEIRFGVGGAQEGSAFEHWKAMIEKPRKQTAEWHELVPSTE